MYRFSCHPHESLPLLLHSIACINSRNLVTRSHPLIRISRRRIPIPHPLHHAYFPPSLELRLHSLCAVSQAGVCSLPLLIPLNCSRNHSPISLPADLVLEDWLVNSGEPKSYLQSPKVLMDRSGSLSRTGPTIVKISWNRPSQPGRLQDFPSRCGG